MLKRWQLFAVPTHDTQVSATAAEVINMHPRTYFFKSNAVYDAAKLEFVFDYEVRIDVVRYVAA